MTTDPDDDRVRRTLADADNLVQQHLTIDISAGLADLDRRQRRRLRPQRRTSQHTPPLVMTRSPECTADEDLANDAAAQDWPQRQSWADTEYRLPEPLHRVGEDLLHDLALAEGPDTQNRRRLPCGIAEFLPVSRAQQQTRVRRTRRKPAALAACLVFCLVVVGAAPWQLYTALQTERQTALSLQLAAQQTALSRQLAAQSAALLPVTPEVAALLSVYAYRSSPTTEAVDSLNNAVAQPLARTLTGHTDSVSAVAYSPDGKHLASAGLDNTVRVWDLTTGSSRSLTGHTDSVSAVAYSPDGTQLATGSGDDTVRVWDLTTGSSRTLTGHTDGVTEVAYSPDGRHLASGSGDKTVRVWDLTTGSSRSLTGHTGQVFAVAYSPDGKHLASAGFDVTDRAWAPTGMAPPQMIGFICGQLRHDLNPDERAKYLPSADSLQPACPSTR